MIVCGDFNDASASLSSKGKLLDGFREVVVINIFFVHYINSSELILYYYYSEMKFSGHNMVVLKMIQYIY